MTIHIIDLCGYALAIAAVFFIIGHKIGTREGRWEATLRQSFDRMGIRKADCDKAFQEKGDPK